jgi:hypothetical protein
MLPLHSLRLLVVAPFTCLQGEMEWLGRTSPAATPTREPLAVAVGWVDWDAPPVDVFLPPGSTAPEAEDQDVDVSGTKLPDHPSSKELSAVEEEARIHKVLDLGVNLTPGASPIPLWRGIAIVIVSTLGPILVTITILPFHCTHYLVQGLGGRPL